MKAVDMSIEPDIDSDDPLRHAARVFAEARRKQLELALEGRYQESATYAMIAATARDLLDEAEALAVEAGVMR